MKSINFNENVESFMINGDESRVIKFNPGDPNLLKRAQEVSDRLSTVQKEMEEIPLNTDGTIEDETKESAKILTEIEDVIRENVNFLFNSDVYDIAFAGQSPLCIVGDEKEYLFEAFINSVLPEIRRSTEKYKEDSKARINKYTKEYSK